MALIQHFGGGMEIGTPVVGFYLYNKNEEHREFLKIWYSVRIQMIESGIGLLDKAYEERFREEYKKFFKKELIIGE